MQNKVHLITYADRLAGDLPGLRAMLDDQLAGLFAGIHILPFYLPIDGADAGFDPDDHTQVDPQLGTWEDIATIAATYDVMADLIVNHVSRNSPQFLDWERHGSASAFDGMFLTADLFPGGVNDPSVALVYRPRPGRPFTEYVIDGTPVHVWTTFTSEQIDIDVGDVRAKDYLASIIHRLADAGVSALRLDAVGYGVKTVGTSCFMTPETFEFIDELAGWSTDRGLEVLVEVHSHYARQVAIADQVDRVYDFALPPLVLHALVAADAEPLVDWMAIRPPNAVTVLDTHDGIGVVDVAAHDGMSGLLLDTQVDALVEAIHDNSEGISRLATGAAASNVDLYQVNSTFYDALGRDDDAYLLARAIQFFTPGVPQVYYVGLLAGINDSDLLSESGVGRDVNRHRYTADEVAEAVERPVVEALFRLIRFRNSEPAFDGEFSVERLGQSVRMRWRIEDRSIALHADVAQRTGRIEIDAEGEWIDYSLWDVPG